MSVEIHITILFYQTEKYKMKKEVHPNQKVEKNHSLKLFPKIK